MIGRPVKGTGFRGVLNYLADKENVRILGGDMAGRNARELAHEFGLLRRQRPGLKRAVAHMFLRPAPGEYLSDEQWKTIARYYLSGMGFSDSPHVLFLDVEPHPHLHLVASRITYSGTVVSDSNDYQQKLGSPSKYRTAIRAPGRLCSSGDRIAQAWRLWPVPPDRNPALQNPPASYRLRHD